MSLTAKSNEFSRVLVDNINMRLGAGVATKSFGTSGDPLVFVQVSSGNHSKKALVRIVPVTPLQTVAGAAVQVDSLGLAQKVVGPHICQVLFDSNGSGATIAQKLAVLGEVLPMGMKVEWYEVDAVAIAETDISSSNLKASFDQLPWRDQASM